MPTHYILLEKDTVGDLVPVAPEAGLLTAEEADRNIDLFKRQAQLGGGDRTIWKGAVTVDEAPVIEPAHPDAPRANEPLEADLKIKGTKQLS